MSIISGAVFICGVKPYDLTRSARFDITEPQLEAPYGNGIGQPAAHQPFVYCFLSTSSLLRFMPFSLSSIVTLVPPQP